MAVVTGFNIPSWHRHRVGISTIGFVLLLIAINVGHWALFVAHSLKLLLRRCKNARRRPKTARELRQESRARERQRLAKQRRAGLALVSIETERGLITTDRARPPSPEASVEDDMRVAAVALVEESLRGELELRGSRQRGHEKDKRQGHSAASRMERQEIGSEEEGEHDAPRRGGTLKAKGDLSLDSAASVGPRSCSANPASARACGRRQQPWHDGSLEASAETGMGQGTLQHSVGNTTLELSAIEIPINEWGAELPTPDLPGLSLQQPTSDPDSRRENHRVESPSSGERPGTSQNRHVLPGAGVGNVRQRPASKQMILPPTGERQKDRDIDPVALRKLLATAKAAKESRARPHKEEEKRPSEGHADAGDDSEACLGLERRLAFLKASPAGLGQPAQTTQAGRRPKDPTMLGPSA